MMGHGGEFKKRRRAAKKNGEYMHKPNPINPIDSTVKPRASYPTTESRLKNVNILYYCLLFSFLSISYMLDFL